MRLYLFIGLLFLNICTLFANTIDLSNEKSNYIGKDISFFEDKDSHFDITKVRQLPESYFKKENEDVFVRFFPESTFWIKVDLINNTQETLKRYFVVDTPWIDTFNIYIYDNQNKLTKYQLGNSLPFEKRSMQINLLNQSHDFKKGKFKVFLEVKTRDPFILPISILSEKSLFEKVSSHGVVEASTYSIVIAIFIFNFLIFIITKYKPYFYYSLYLFSYLMMSFGYESYTFKYIFYDFPQIQSWMQSIPISIYLLCSLLFAKSFLELKEKLPKINRYVNIVLIIHVVLIIITAILGYRSSIMYATCITTIFSIYMVFLGVYSFLKGNKKAIFFILATICGCTGAFFTASVSISFIEYNWYFFKGVDIGIMIDSILFSIALAYRYTSLNLILEKTKNEVIELNENLENQVEIRTLDLAKEVDNKTVLLKELSHRVKNNLQIISALLSMDKEKIKDKNSKQIFENNIKRIKSISILYENFLESEDTNNVDLKEYIKKIISEFKHNYITTNVEFELDAKIIFLDQKQLIPLGLVVNELIINSIKYAFDKENGKICISIFSDGTNIHLNYKDNGKGTDIKKLKSGFGFGLIDSLISFQLSGNVECFSKDGLEYKITVPK